MDGLQSSETLQSSARSPEERLARRRIRRWKRRGRIAAPFVGISILFVTLTLSVDFIEYEPTTESERLSDRPMYLEPIGNGETVGHRVSLNADSFASINSLLPDQPGKNGERRVDRSRSQDLIEQRDRDSETPKNDSIARSRYSARQPASQGS
jgi:hypothetical protein